LAEGSARQFDSLSDNVLSRLNTLNISEIIIKHNPSLMVLMSALEKLGDKGKQIAEQLQYVNQTLNDLLPKIDNLKGNVTEILNNAKYNNMSMDDTVQLLFEIAANASTYVSTTGPGYKMIMDATNTSMEGFTDLGDQFIDFITDFIEKDFGACRPVSDIYSAVEVIMCDEVITPVSGLWLGLGTLTLGWTVLALFGLCLKSVLSRSDPRPVYVSRHPPKKPGSNVATAPTANMLQPPGIEMTDRGSRSSYGSYTSYGGGGVHGGDSPQHRLSRQISGDPHHVAKNYLNTLERKKYH